MKKIGDCIEVENLNKPEKERSKESFSEIEQKIINKLFVTFENIFQGFRVNYGTPESYNGAKRQWLIAFKTENISDTEKIRLVCNECRKMESPFMLTLGKFISIYKSLGAYDKKYPLVKSNLIESKKASPEVFNKNMDRIKNLLR